ncbi:MAG TPA: heme o synthase [Pyrinomonadaceae bacterium]|nr:heme o synthase [Pyrinomonadaceae bacterium]
MSSVSLDQATTVDIGLKGKVSAYIELTKPRIALLLVLVSAAAFYLASPSPLNYVLFAHSMIAITLLAFGVATLNQWLERDIDPLMKRTLGRPIPSGRVSQTEALVFGALLCIAAEVYLALAVNLLTAALGLVVIVGYVLVYTPLKTRTSASTAIGAIPGAMPPLMGWTAAADSISIAAWGLFAMQFLWQFPHFFAIAWMYRDQYKNAGIKMLPVVEKDGSLTFRQIVLFTVMLIPISISPYVFGVSGEIFFVGAVVLGLWHLVESIVTAKRKSDKAARRLLLVTVLYLPLLFLLMVIDKR